MVGDYILTSWSGDRAFGAFAVAAAAPGAFDQRVFVPAGGASAAAFPNVTRAEQAFSDNGASQANPRSVIRPAHKAE